MASQQGQYFTYRARNNKTGLTDVKANIYVGATAKFVGSNAIAMTEQDATNSPGLYYGNLTPAQMTTLGASQTGKLNLILYINSASASLADQMRLEVTVATIDDIDVKLGTPVSSSIAGDIAALSAQILNLNNGLNSLTGAAANNGSAIIAINETIPASGNKTFKVPVKLRNANGIPIVPSSISVQVANTEGVDRGSYITGATSSGGGPYTLVPTAASPGTYQIPFSLPSTAIPENWMMMVSYTYTDNGQTITDMLFAVLAITTDILAAGLATASALATVQSGVTSIISKLTDSLTGLVNIENLAQQAATSAANGYAQGQANATAVANVQTSINQTQGSGFDTTKNSLVALTAAIAQNYAFMQANLVTGGKAV